jgi:hypothetical protein
VAVQGTLLLEEKEDDEEGGGASSTENETELAVKEGWAAD